LVRSVKGGDDAAAMLALEQLCNSYWYPVYAFIRRSGRSPHDAEDLTQGFFAKLLDKATLANADPTKGKLRTFLLTCVRRFVGDEMDKAMAQKRGARLLVSFNADWAEDRYAVEPVDDLTPDRLFQRRWALTVLEFSLQLLEEEYKAQGKADLFEALRPFLGFKAMPAQSYEDAATGLKMPVGTLKSHVSRLRHRWREMLFEQVSVTLNNPTPENIKSELTELLECV
jgi:DNA-directed RNA polymerase specialized sigma24 family protein